MHKCFLVFDLMMCNFVCVHYSGECTESEEKAQVEYDKVYEGMKGVTEKMDALAAQKKEQGKRHGQIHK
jgi:hypothetical protein